MLVATALSLWCGAHFRTWWSLFVAGTRETSCFGGPPGPNLHALQHQLQPPQVPTTSILMKVSRSLKRKDSRVRRGRPRLRGTVPIAFRSQVSCLYTSTLFWFTPHREFALLIVKTSCSQSDTILSTRSSIPQSWPRRSATTTSVYGALPP